MSFVFYHTYDMSYKSCRRILLVQILCHDFVVQNVNANLTHYFYPITSNAKKIIFSLEDFGLSLPVCYPISLLFLT